MNVNEQCPVLRAPNPPADSRRRGPLFIALPAARFAKMLPGLAGEDRPEQGCVS